MDPAQLVDNLLSQGIVCSKSVERHPDIDGLSCSADDDRGIEPIDAPDGLRSVVDPGQCLIVVEPVQPANTYPDRGNDGLLRGEFLCSFEGQDGGGAWVAIPRPWRETGKGSPSCVAVFGP